MNTDQHITCPNCSHQFSIASTLGAQIRKQLEKEQQVFWAQEQQKLAQSQQQLDADKKKIALEYLEFQSKVKAEAEKEKQKMWQLAKEKAVEQFQDKLNQSEQEQQKMKQQLVNAEKQELAVLQLKRELEEKERRFELDKARQLEFERKKIQAEAVEAADQAHRMKMAEKEKAIAMMVRQIDELKRKSEQGSMQIQGEVQEDDLKAILVSNFPLDQVSDVEKGVRGADLVQTVRNAAGEKCGVIVWESKNTKDWKDEWIKKLRDDQHLVQGDICVIVTQALPKGVERFVQLQGVWVVQPTLVLILTHALRQQLIHAHSIRKSALGKEEKMEVLYQYLSGMQFKSRVENIVTAFMTMQDQLNSEKRALNTIWNRREKEIQRIIDQTSGMYGDLQGIIGSALPVVEQLGLPGENSDVRSADFSSLPL